MKKVNDVWASIASKWYIPDYNRENDVEIEKEFEMNAEAYEEAINWNDDIDWDKDDDLGF